MDKECNNLLNSLSNKEYKVFLQNAIGLHYFKAMNHVDFSVENKKRGALNIDKNKKITIFAYVYINRDDLVDYYYFLDKEEKIFFNMNGEKFDLNNYFDKSLGNDIVYLLLLSSRDKKDYSDILKRDFGTLSSTIRNDIFSYNFILGTGVDLGNEDSKGFSVTNWSQLITRMENNITSSINLTNADLKKIKNKIGNTDYVLPQIAKDVNCDAYFQTIYECLYKGFTLDCVDKTKNSNLKNETLYCIAEVLATQSLMQKKQEVLTFNYDNFLELILKTNFNLISTSNFKGVREINSNIEILHAHGFLPFEGLLSNEKNKYQDSIVLSSFEYMDMYEDSYAYSYSKLYNQLHKTNLIIGNSMVDHEEEKVFRNHHKNYLSEYSYVLTKKSDLSYGWLDAYRTMMFLQMGVLPVFFDKHSDIRDFIKNLINSLD